MNIRMDIYISANKTIILIGLALNIEIIWVLLTFNEFKSSNP